MAVFQYVYALHLLAAVVWVGGMFFAWAILSPALAASLEWPLRLRVWLQVLPRFFAWVWGALVMLPVSGMAMLQMQWHGFDTAPRYVQAMMGLYVVMVAIFLRLQTLQLPEIRRAAEAERWDDAAAAMKRIRVLVGINLLAGLTVVAIAALRPHL